MCVRTEIKHVDWEVQGACPWQAGRAQRVPCHWCRLKCKFDNLNKTLVAKERLKMCTRTGLENVYWGDQGLAPGMAKRSECCGISAGLSITLMIQMKEAHQKIPVYEKCV